MDDFLFIIYIYILFMVPGMAMFCMYARQIFFADDIQMAHDRALLWISMANPFLWMSAARCAKCGSRDFKWLRIG